MKDILKQIINHIQIDSCDKIINSKFKNELKNTLNENILNFKNKNKFKFNVFNVEFNISFNHEVEDEELRKVIGIVGILSWKFNYLGNNIGSYTNFNQEIIDINEFEDLSYLIEKQIKETYLSISLSEYSYKYQNGTSIKESLLNYIDKLGE